MKKFTINSQIQIDEKIFPEFSLREIKNEPMLHKCDLKHSLSIGEDITRAFLEALPNEFTNSPDLYIDSRTHMLMKGWYPCIPGFHHDDVPRSRADKQPNYDNPEYHAKHVLLLLGDCCPTEFVIGESDFEEVPEGKIIYKEWDKALRSKMDNKQDNLKSILVPERHLVFFDWQSWHQGTAAIRNGWRFFIRATINTKHTPRNEERKQVQVYMDDITAGW